MANYYAQVNLAAATGETADVNVNVLAATGPNVITSVEFELWADVIKSMYNTWNFVGGFLNGRAQNGHTIKFYSAVTTTPNYPIYETSFNFAAAPGAIDLPLEVSLCVSYQCDSAVTIPVRRRRGRIYISGFTEAHNTAGRPTSTVTGNLGSEFRDYCEALNDVPDFTACIWSRANASLYPIERCWVDNEWDTMRSRGGKSTARSEYAIVF